jgi:hypothetical protein
LDDAAPSRAPLYRSSLLRERQSVLILRDHLVSNGLISQATEDVASCSKPMLVNGLEGRLPGMKLPLFLSFALS